MRTLDAFTFLFLALTAVAPLLAENPAGDVAPAAALLGAAVCLLRRPRRRGLHAASWSRNLPRNTRDAVRFLLHLSPVALLTLVFPLATHRIVNVEVDGTSLTTLLLASSLTVPWLSQATCLPLYRAIGVHVSQNDMPGMRRRFCQAWPAALAKSAPVIVLFAAPVELVMRFSAQALTCYVILCVLHVAFAQALIPGNVEKRRGVWAVAWTAYAAALFVVPQLWFLPPLAGLLTQVVVLRRDLPAMRRPDPLENADVAADLLRGTLLGAVLWSDKFVLFLVTGGKFAVSLVFLAMLPAVLAYNYYFVRLAPHFDDSVVDLRTAIESESYAVLSTRSGALTDTVFASVRRTAVFGAGLACLTTYVVGQVSSVSLGLIASVAIASWAFTLTTIACYKLDYAGERKSAQLFSACHLLLCLALFAVAPFGAGLYVAFAIGETVLLLAVLASCLRHWKSSEYTLFWRHATAW